MSIKENIAYGNNNRDDISMEEIIEAAKNANIHDFVQSLPNVSDKDEISTREGRKIFSSGI
jgi:ATP-binding cassette subfamily B (MDR/TAP) protein 1